MDVRAEHFRTDAFELRCWRRLLKVPWTARRSNQSILKEISPGCSLEGLMLKLKLILWPPDAKSWLIWKDPDAGKDWGREEKGTTEDEMVGRHNWLNGHGFGWTLGVGDGQGGLVCCVSWGRKESDTTERLNWTERQWFSITPPATVASIERKKCQKRSKRVKITITKPVPFQAYLPDKMENYSYRIMKEGV